MRSDASPRFSVVVPARSIDPIPALLDDLSTLDESSPVEVLIATGTNPSRQRNLAAAEARGEWLVFLDSDCRVQTDHFERLAHHADRLEIVGGPVLLLAGAAPLEITFQNLLGHPLLTGASSSRYQSKGRLRQCNDAELILCNLAVRRDRFLESKGFDEQLYPNEENEWLTRLRARGVDCWHDPELVVRRPQRKSWQDYVRMLTGYGRGRTRQFLVSGKWDIARQLPAFALLAWLTFLLFRPRAAAKTFITAWLGLGAACRIFSCLRAVPSQHFPITAALIAPTVPVLYAAGQLMGFLHPTLQKPPCDVRVYRWECRFRTFVPTE